MKDIEKKVRELLADISKETYVLEIDSTEELGIDSITFVRLVIELEDEYNIEFDEFDLNIQSFQKIDDYVKYIQDKLQHKE